ncbi:MAG TPA: spore germination protein [Firmicutes bacterium]|jgi:hypothetical protein|nr:spore germination protein [Bacillota bacterium]HAZ22341.1 spore germination protein [Bacillota bacterium]HBE05433.1 spore germination protein [Bacillota bacterium]HBL50631.1 spore germination protein [Bacillota bacterium]HBL67539.1 spore germination protein [Bacillota bacterium]
MGQAVFDSLDANFAFLEEALGHSFDAKFRRFVLSRSKGPPAGIMFIDGLTNEEILHRDILRPLMLDELPLRAGPLPEEPIAEIAAEIAAHLLLVAEVEIVTTFNAILDGVFSGDTVLFVDGVATALLINTKGWASRSIENPDSESDIRGPRDAFNEDLLTNVTRLRRRVKDAAFHCETLAIGARTRTQVALVFLKDRVNPKVLQQVQDILKNIDIDGVIDSGYLQEFLQGRRWSIFPLVQSTERPDRASAALLEGRIVIIVDNSPFALVLPAVLASMFQAAGDYYHPSPIGTFLRIIRVIGWMLGMFLPGLYVALSSVNPEVMPPALAIALAASREGVPYPAIFEVLVMDIAIELLAEASTRLPSLIGGAATLVGGLIIGSAAVEANIISSTMIIVVAITAIGLFTIPSYELGLAWRIAKYLITISAAFFGIFGIANAFILLVIYLSSLQSFGQPYLSPVGPYRPGDYEDFILRAPWWKLNPTSRTFDTEQPHEDSDKGGR